MDVESFQALREFRSSVPFLCDVFVAYAEPVERWLSSHGTRASYLAIGRNPESEFVVDDEGRLCSHQEGAWFFVDSSLRQFLEVLRALDSFLADESDDVAGLRGELTAIDAAALEPNAYWAFLIEEYEAGVL
jgi:hypothetical protein